MTPLKQITYKEVTPIGMVVDQFDLVRNYYKDKSDERLERRYSEMSHFMCFYYLEYYMWWLIPKCPSLKSLLLK